MNLAALLGLKLDTVQIVLVGVPVETNILDSEDQPYYVAKLKTPYMVRCSVDNLIDPQEVDEVYLRKSALTSEGWKFVDEKKPEEGFFMEGWVADFSKSQGIPIYQSTTIKKYFNGTRGDKRDQERERINASIREKMAARKKS